MKVRVLKSLIYDGNAYNENEEIDILDMYVDNLITRKLVEKIKGEKTNDDTSNNQNINDDSNSNGSE